MILILLLITTTILQAKSLAIYKLSKIKYNPIFSNIRSEAMKPAVCKPFTKQQLIKSSRNTKPNKCLLEHTETKEEFLTAQTLQKL